MTTVSPTIAALASVEHERGLHDDYRLRYCADCYPDGLPVQQPTPTPDAGAPVPVISRPNWRVAEHSFRWTSMRTVEGEYVCECSQPKSSTIHTAPPPGGLGSALDKVVARVAARSGQPRFRDEVWVDPYLDLEPSDGGPKCATCRGFRKIGRGLDRDHPDFGKLMDCPASTCTSWLAQQRLDKLLGEIPLHFRDWTLETVVSAYPMPEVGARMADWGRQWIADTSVPPPWALLHGHAGRGKTVLAVAVLKAFVAVPGHTGTFQRAGRLLRLVRDTYGTREGYHLSERDILAALHQADLFVLDDLGQENDTDWASELLAEVIEGRYQNRLRTIITSNFTIDELGDRIGIPTASRIAEMAPDIYRRDFDKLPNLRQPAKGVSL